MDVQGLRSKTRHLHNALLLLPGELPSGVTFALSVDGTLLHDSNAAMGYLAYQKKTRGKKVFLEADSLAVENKLQIESQSLCPQVEAAVAAKRSSKLKFPLTPTVRFLSIRGSTCRDLLHSSLLSGLEHPAVRCFCGFCFCQRVCKPLILSQLKASSRCFLPTLVPQTTEAGVKGAAATASSSDVSISLLTVSRSSASQL